MQTRKTIEYDLKTLPQIVLDTIKNLRHAGNVIVQSAERSEEYARVSIKEKPDEIPKEKEERWLQCQNFT